MDEFLRGKKLAMRFLATRMYTSREIFDRLRRKGYSAETAEEVVTELIEEGLLDDKRFAEFYISDNVSIGYKGIYRIKQELLRKGVPGSVIDRAVANAEIDCEEALREFVRQKLSVTDIETRKDYERFRTMLARRGYSLSEINEVLSEYDFDLN